MSILINISNKPKISAFLAATFHIPNRYATLKKNTVKIGLTFQNQNM